MKKVRIILNGLFFVVLINLVHAQQTVPGTTQSTDTYIANRSMVVDEVSADGGNGNDGANLRPGLVFGGFYQSEGIASNRYSNANGNQNGLDFITNNIKRISITNGGNVGINTNVPSKLLHIKGFSGTAPVIQLEALVNTSPSFEFKYNGTVTHDITYSSTNSQFKIGPTNGAYKSLYFRTSGTGSLIFSNSPTFATSGQSGLDGTYLFDAQVSATSLMVSPTGVSGSYPTIQSGGYIFNVKGDSYLKGKTVQDGLLQVNNTTDLDPTNVIAGTKGLTIANSIAQAPTSFSLNYSWIQSEARPLALNPITNSDSTTANTSYVAVGFIPGRYNVPVGYKLAVKGRIICEELKIKFAGQWSDYVFAKDYKLRELREVEEFISENKHLPDVPSEVEIKDQGIEAGQMDATLLRKIEELTLYMIQMNKQIDHLQKENVELRKMIQK